MDNNYHLCACGCGEITRSTYLRGHHNKTNEARKQLSKRQIGKHISKEHKENVSYGLIEYYKTHPHQHRSIKSRDKVSESLKRYHQLHPMPEETRQKKSISMKAVLFAHPEKHPNSIMASNRIKGSKGGYLSKGQFKLYLEVKQIYPEAQLNSPIRTSSNDLYFGDIVIPSIKEIIEYDGGYWHDGRIESDKIRDFNLNVDGWKIRRITDKEYNPYKHCDKRLKSVVWFGTKSNGNNGNSS